QARGSPVRAGRISPPADRRRSRRLRSPRLKIPTPPRHRATLLRPVPMKTETAKRVGIVGAGQLGRMLALAGEPLRLRFDFRDKSADAPGGQVGDISLGAFGDADKLRELSECVDVVTFDVENVPVDAVRAGVTKPFRPTVELL